MCGGGALIEATGKDCAQNGASQIHVQQLLFPFVTPTITIIIYVVPTSILLNNKHIKLLNTQ